MSGVADTVLEIETADNALSLLNAVGHFHDWYVMECRSVANFTFSKAAVGYPNDGLCVALRVTNGESEVRFLFYDVAMQRMGRPDAIMNATIKVVGADGGLRIDFALDDAQIIARRVVWWRIPFVSTLTLGPAPSDPHTTPAASLGDGWVQCPSCTESWQPRWNAEHCPSCGLVLRC